MRGKELISLGSRKLERLKCKTFPDLKFQKVHRRSYISTGTYTCTERHSKTALVLAHGKEFELFFYRIMSLSFCC